MQPTEVELKLLVPAPSRAGVIAEMGRAASNLERVSLAAIYLDTPDRRLARAGLSWRLRREGRRWVQTLKAAGAHSVERFEHEVIRPDASHDATAHAHTDAGKLLADLLDAARGEGVEVHPRFKTEVRRTVRRVRARGAVVEVAFDEGKLIAGENSLRLCELEFELVSGSTQAMLALAERWRKRFGLIYEPRTKAERGDRLAAGSRFPPVRKGERVAYPRRANPNEALGAVLDECLAHITHNAIGLSEGDPAQRVEHIHQLRVGVRRLRSALRSFEEWTPAPPADMVESLKALFTELGRSRDTDVLEGGVSAELAKISAPRLEMTAQEGQGVDVVQAVRDAAVQRAFLSWLAWRISLVEPAESNSVSAHEAPSDQAGAVDRGADAVVVDAEPRPENLRRNAEKRLRRWHRRIAADWEAFDGLDEPALHALRKRIKRQRYAVEFFRPLLRRREVSRYLKPLAVAQERMGELNDLFVARAHYQKLVDANPQAWFALGWIAARIADVRALAGSELRALAKARSPSH